jgi:hypothetical protein
MGAKPVNGDHALLCGFVWGAFMRAGIPAFPGLDAEGNYTSDLILNFSEISGEPLQVTITVNPRPVGPEPGL